MTRFVYLADISSFSIPKKEIKKILSEQKIEFLLMSGEVAVVKAQVETAKNCLRKYWIRLGEF